MLLDEYQTETGLTNYALAKKIGISRQSTGRYRTGEQIPRRDTMRKIIDLTGGRVQEADFYRAYEAFAARKAALEAPKAA